MKTLRCWLRVHVTTAYSPNCFELELAERLAESPYRQRWQHVCTSCYVDPFYNAYTPHLMLEDAFQI